MLFVSVLAISLLTRCCEHPVSNRGLPICLAFRLPRRWLPSLRFFLSAFKIFSSHPCSGFICAERSGMLINRDLVSYMAAEIVKKLTEGELVEVKNAAAVTQRVRQAMVEEITVEDRINEEARQILL